MVAVLIAAVEETHRQQRSHKSHRPGAAKINVQGRGRKSNQLLTSVSGVASLHAGSCLAAARAEIKKSVSAVVQAGICTTLTVAGAAVSTGAIWTLSCSLWYEINHRNGMTSFAASAKFLAHVHDLLF